MFRDACRARAADPAARGCLACTSVAELVGVHDGRCAGASFPAWACVLTRSLRPPVRGRFTVDAGVAFGGLAWMVRPAEGDGYEFHILAAGLAFALVVTGGLLSIDRALSP